LRAAGRPPAAAAPSKSSKLNLPSRPFTRFTFRPDSRTSSTIVSPRNSGSSFTASCADPSEAKGLSLARSERLARPIDAPMLGQKASRNSPSSLRVRPVCSLTKRSISPLSWLGSNRTATAIATTTNSPTSAPRA